MGLNAAYLNYIENAMASAISRSGGEICMLELGDQEISDPAIAERTGKAYFENRGIKHVSVDLNGLHGSLVRDLRKPRQFLDLHERFDVVTNAGTTEHVEPLSAQFECFNILHDCAKVGGILIHLNPDVDELDNSGAWKYHCSIYYSAGFYDMLAAACHYELLSNTVISGLRCAVVKKTPASTFMQDRRKFLSKIAYRRIPMSIKGRTKASELLRRWGLR